MYTEKIVEFYCAEDNFQRCHQVSFRPDTDKKEIVEILTADFGGEIEIIGYEYY